MKMITLSKQSTLFLLMISTSLFFFQCNNGEKEEADTASFNEEEAMYPAEKVQQNTNLESNEPLEMDKPFWSIDKSILLATLNKHKTEIEYKIQQMGNDQEASNGAISPQASLQELKSYKEELDEEITRVRMTSEDNFPEVAESAQETLQNIGAKVASTYIRIERGF